MELPSVLEARMLVQKQATAIATSLLRTRGFGFVMAETRGEVLPVLIEQFSLMRTDGDLLAAAAAFHQLSWLRATGILTFGNLECCRRAFGDPGREGMTLLMGACNVMNDDDLSDGHYSRRLVRMLCREGDAAYYDGKGGTSHAAICYQLAAALAPDNANAHFEAISAVVQGKGAKPSVALPHAIVLAAINPGRRREVDYVMQHMNAV